MMKFISVKMVEHNRFSLSHSWMSYEIALGALRDVFIKQACKCATQWRSIFVGDVPLY